MRQGHDGIVRSQEREIRQMKAILPRKLTGERKV